MSTHLPHTFCEAFQQTATRLSESIALRTPGDGQTITWGTYAQRVRSIAAGLANLGVGHGDTVALMLTNRPEFHLVDTAAMHLGAIGFSIYNTNPPETIAYLLANAGSRVVITESQFLPQISAARAAGRSVEEVIVVDGTDRDSLTLAAIERKPLPGFDFEATWRSITPEDVLTIIYTSGTTGAPKGVELTHANILASIDGASELVTPGVRHRVVSYLPDAHIINRWACHYFPMVDGGVVTDLANHKEIVAALADARPTMFLAVPQIWYKIKAAIEARMAAESNPVKKALGVWAVDVGRRTARAETTGGRVPPLLKAQHAVADRLVLARIRAELGLDQLDAGATGAAPIAREAHEFVLGLGLPISEAFGMSELSAVSTLNRRGKMRLGTVGTPARGVQVRLADDGELLVRGPIVMKGYRNSPEQTADAVDAEGWMHTGDIATIDADGYVSIVERKKELIINSGGKNMSPSKIEGFVKVACPLVGSVVAIGDNKPYVIALITLDAEAAAAYAREHGLDASPASLATDPGVLSAVDTGVREANTKLARVEQIKKFTVLPVTWEPGGDELTPTMKLRRKPIAAKYANDIDALYAGR
ncbi:AMP-dependent synthetase/ligase [Nocardia sp. CA-107356]|uniref:AMP-dependent synthetase/ligase n=1 Tax=Nocardia sp. CA-107356 TaxID=3239972 RepID=UPI003D8EBDF8